ncbi:uncharacterized protein TOT_020000343 [Theileria orientalis strain Shintoku]|uniref:Uncharacterized protein n=1 Tax=Theileria orientalis strain Shintoku TaxID=869250 RepID=J4D7B4_THEOR|nr:uncharacterized protein TOT_020000343 [Theileria orientalis strain Shintoku]BAM40080.1 uncharacterized protein TOT_020000343 [Theileria orientalis strain Shintoku]|eukprot:XP_009690381.1 uncharacterized protein TOT_020000343 [Theileria orientalis strain Shintoku]
MNVYGKVPSLIFYSYLYIQNIKGHSIPNLKQDLNNYRDIRSKYIKADSSRTGHVSTGANEVGSTQIVNHKRALQQTGTCLVSVDIKERECTEEVYYEYNEEDDTHTFTPTRGCLIRKVTKGTRLLWHSKDFNHQYGSRVFVGINEDSEPVFRVYFPRTEIVEDHREHNPNLVRVDLQDRYSNGFFSYKYDPNLQAHTFTPKPPYAFYKATKGNHVVWKHEDGNFPSRLLIFTDDYGQSVLRVQFPKSDGDMTGEEVEPFDPMEGIEIITEGSPKANDSTKYTVKIDSNVCLFRFNEGAKCTQVRHMGQKVWSHGDFGYEEYPVSVGYFTNKIIDVYMGGPLIFYERSLNGVWKGKESDLIIYVLDPDYPKKKKQISVDQYDLRIEHGDIDYLLYKGVKCTKVKHKYKTIWKYDGDEYPTSITYIEDNMIYIYFTRTFVLYVRDRDGEWNEHHSDDIYKKNRQVYKRSNESRFDMFKWVDKYA